jgi:hypothetical protein
MIQSSKASQIIDIYVVRSKYKFLGDIFKK